MHPLAMLQSLVILMLANGAPVVLKKILGLRFARALDGGWTLFDRRPLFGSSKTIRGILASILITTACAPIIGLDPEVGAAVASAAMAGDLFSSFVKRRLNWPPRRSGSIRSVCPMER
jgi:CDP-diglyceride synthetase